MRCSDKRGMHEGHDQFPRWRTALGWLALLAAGAASGCVSYAPQHISAMSPLELCEFQMDQRVNLSAGTNRALQAELERRNVECGRHATELAMRREARLHELMYRVHDDP
jgi:hypothetical protein